MNRFQHIGIRETSMPAKKTPSVPALERGLAILELVANSRSGLTFSQIARSVSFPKSSVHCLLVTFEREEYLRRTPTSGRYVYGPRLARLAHLALNGAAIREQAAPVIRNLADRLGLTVHVAILEGDEAILIAKAAPIGSHSVATWMGKRIDVHCTSLGKCLVAYLPDSELERLTRERGLFRHNENTICSITRLKQDLERTRRQGYAIDDEEEELGIRCIGVPLFDRGGGVLAALSVSGTIEQVSRENCDPIAGLLKAAALEIAARLDPPEEPAKSA
jgi:DNA-binding IclR family transcriptional regulator